MKIIERIEDFENPDPAKPVVLTIGNFDGVHRGHQVILRRLNDKTKKVDGHQLLITFSNHPSEILNPNHPIPLLCTLEHKLKLIESSGVDTLLLLPFTRSLANHSAADFIKKIRRLIPFEYLLLGYDATFGKDRQGKPQVIQGLASDWGFEVEYLEEYRYEGKPVSSSRIRDLLQAGDLEQVEELLGRPYSIYLKAPVIDQIQSLQFVVKGLCMPPSGVYPITVKTDKTLISGTAYLNTDTSILKVNLDEPLNCLKDLFVEIVFRS